MNPSQPGYVKPSDRIWIACPLKEPGVPKPITAQAIERCRECDRRIWVAGSTIEILLTRPKGAWVSCIPCWSAYAKAHPKEFKKFELHTTTSQRLEVYAATGRTVEEAFAPYGIKLKLLDLKKGQV